MSMILLLTSAWLAGMGGQTMIDPVFSTGYEAVAQNPGILGVTGGPSATFNWVGFRLRGRSNRFTYDDYRRYIAKPVRLSQADEQHILDLVGPGPLELAARSDLSVLQFQYRNWGAGADLMWLVKQALPREVFELTLNGNELNRTYDLAGFATDSIALLRVSGATGIPFGREGGIGLGLSWLHGLNYVNTTTSSGQLLTTEYAMTGYLSESRRQADAGDGFALNLGGTAKVSDRWRLGLSLRDLPGLVYWYHNAGTRDFTVTLDSLDAWRYREKQSLDSFVMKSNTNNYGHSFWYALPPIAALGVGYEPGGRWRLAGLANLPLKSDPFVAAPPLAAVRLDWRPAQFFQLNVMPGLHLEKGFGGHFGMGFSYRGVGLFLDTEGWGLPKTKDAMFRIQLGYNAGDAAAYGDSTLTPQK